MSRAFSCSDDADADDDYSNTNTPDDGLTQHFPSAAHPPPRWLRDDGDDDGSMLGLRLPLSLKMIDGLCGTQFLLLLPCPGPGLHPTHSLPCSFHVVLHFFVCAPSSDTARELRNKSPYIYIYIAYSIYTRTNCMLYIYNFFHSCLSFCVMRFALLRFWPSRFVAVRVSRVIKKQPPQPLRQASASY